MSGIGGRGHRVIYLMKSVRVTAVVTANPCGIKTPQYHIYIIHTVNIPYIQCINRQRQSIKDKVYHRTGHEGPGSEQRYSSTLSLTSSPDWGQWTTPRPSHSTSGKETRYPFYRRLGGTEGRYTLVEKISTHRDSILRPCSLQRVSIPTELTRSTKCT